MRYRIGEPPDQPTGPLLDQGGNQYRDIELPDRHRFNFAGLRSRHYWLTIWGSGLALSSVGYLVFVALA